jgi:hypothetical protein
MSWDRFWRWYDRGARVDLFDRVLSFFFDWRGWIAASFGGGGGALTFLSAAVEGRSPLDVWVVAVLVAAALSALVYFLIGIAEKLRNARPKTLNDKFPPATVKYILIQDAAKSAFEAAEELGILNLVSSVHSNQNDKLEYFLFAFLSDQRIAIFGKRSPSRNLRLISHDELKQLHPIAGKSSLRSDFASSAEIFEDVSIAQTDLDQYLERLKGLRDLGTRSI